MEGIIMPAKDGRGPRGRGSRTGRGLGDCLPGNNGVAPRDGRGYGQGPFGWIYPLCFSPKRLKSGARKYIPPVNKK